MKKLSLVLVILLAFGASMFADDAAEVTMPTVEEAAAAIDDLATVKGLLAPSISGNATLTFGINLDNMTTGFANAETSGLKLTLVPKATANSGTIGVIEIKDYKLELTPTGATGSTGAVTAKLVFGPLSIAVYNEPAVKADKASFSTAADTELAGGGTTITYAVNDDMSFGVMVESDGDWTANAENDYAFGVTGKVDVSVLSFPFVFAYSMKEDADGNTPMGFGVAPKVTFGDLAVTFAFDGDLTDGFAWDFVTSVVYELPEDSDVGVSFKMDGQESDMVIALDFDEDGDVGEGAIGVIGANADFSLTLSDPVAWDFSVSAKFNDGSGIVPDFAFGTDSAKLTTFSVGCDFQSALTGFDNTTIMVDYGNLTIDASGAEAVTTLGNLTVGAKVAY